MDNRHVASATDAENILRKKHTGEPGNKGEFGLHALAPSGLNLAALPTVDRDLFAARRAALTDAGYVPGVATAAIVGAQTTARRQDWWDTHFMQAEYRPEAGYPQMPDDYTPNRTEGQALSGHRRTHRMAYRTGGVTLRMPSRTAINRYAKETGGTFDVPVTASLSEGGDVQGWVRVTNVGNGAWATSGVGFPAGMDDGISEAVAATLERRMAGPAPTEFSDLIERRKARMAAQGIQLKDVTSTWIASLGYDKSAGVMATMTASGNVYGHQVDADTFNQVASSYSPGAAFNKLVKGSPGVQLERCSDCGRYKALDGAHACPTAHKAPTTTDLERRQLLRAYAARVASSTTGAPTPPPAPAPEPTPPPGTGHVAPGQDHQNIDVADVLASEYSPRSNGKPNTMHGPRGWTLDVADTMQRYTDSLHEPFSYMFGETNGRNGLVRFGGLDAQGASELAQKLPRDAFSDRQNDAPSLGTLLAAANANPGQVELSGYVVGPGRDDERVTVDGVYIYDDELIANADPGTMLRAAKDLYGLHDARRRPDELSVVDVPWQPGKKAIFLWWD